MQILEILNQLEENQVYLSLDGLDLEVSTVNDDVPEHIIGLIRDNKALLVKYLNKIQTEEVYQSIPVLPMQESYVLSSAQMRLWVLSQFQEMALAYNMPFSLGLMGNYNLSFFDKAIHSVIQRHEILRTIFKADENGDIKQWIIPYEEFNFKCQFYDFSKQPNGQIEAKKIIEEDSYMSFNLENGPLIRVKFFELANEQCILYYNMHHIISDGWSINIISKDVLTYYEAYLEDRKPNISPLVIQYKDYANWQQNQLQSQEYTNHKEYWLQKLSGDFTKITLPKAKKHTVQDAGVGRMLKTYLNTEHTDGIRKFIEAQGGSLFTFLLTTLKILFHRYTGQNDIILGSPIAGRDHADLEEQIGFYVNTLVLRNTLASDSTFGETYGQIKENLLADYSHQMYPYDELVDALNLKGNNPLFDIMIILQNTSNTKQKITLPKEIVEAIEDCGKAYVKFDLLFNFTEIENHIVIQLEYDEDVYEYKTVTRIIEHFKGLIASILNDTHTSIGQLNYIPKLEQSKILEEFNNNTSTYPQEKTILDLFEEQVKRTPTLEAIRYEQKSWSYQEINDIANNYASTLYSHFSVSNGDRVIVSLAYGKELIPILIAIKKIGAIYVSLDPTTPSDRIEYVIKDSKSVLFIDSEFINKLSPIVTKPETQELPVLKHTNSETVEFIIYTSGSTGNPKGIKITSKGVINRLHWMWNKYPYAKGEVACAKTSISFVDHICEIYGPLLKGIPLVLFNKEAVIDIKNFIHKLHSNQISRIVLVPSLLREMMKYPDVCNAELQALRICISSGEALRTSDVHSFYSVLQNNTTRLINIYGSTEVTADATYYDTYERFNQNKNKEFKLFSTSLKSEIENIIETHDSATKIIENPLSELLKDAYFTKTSIDENVSIDEYIKFIETKVIPNVVNVNNTSYIGHMTGPIPEIMRQLSSLVVALNQNQVKIETSSVATIIERQLIGIFHNLAFNLPKTFYDEYVQEANSSLGIITNGGTMSNVTAMYYTLNKKLKPKNGFEGLAKEGLVNALQAYGYSKVVLLGSKWCHYSFDKTLKILGLGSKAFVELDFDNKTKEEISSAISKLKEERALILGIIGVAGTTESGYVESLDTIGQIASQHDIHYHVDAAFGGAYLMDEELKNKLNGIELADSVTICAHKQFYVPIGVSICLFKDPNHAVYSEFNARYQARSESYDLGKFTIEGSRNFMSFILHGALHIVGKEGFAEVLRQNHELAKTFADIITHQEDFELMYEPTLNIVLYRYIPLSLRGQNGYTDEEIKIINTLNKKIQLEQFENGNSFVSFTTITKKENTEKQVVFRTVFMNPFTTVKDIYALLNEQRAIAGETQHLSDYKPTNGKDFNIPIGKPIENVKVYVLDANLNLLPIGVTGEICISGDCLSEGYIGANDLNKNRFIENHFLTGERLFLTGDLGRWTEDGDIEFLGRKDNQVKIRGNRIELTEIENTLLRKKEIEQVIVTTFKRNETNEEQLAMYFISTIEESITGLRSFIKQFLPDYMLPDHYIQLTEFPLTVSGKIDKKNLPSPLENALTIENEYVPPRNEIETKLVQIWEEVLQKKTIGIKDDFFELGGQSLKMAQVINKIHKELSLHIAFPTFFNNATVEKVAEKLVEKAYTAITKAAILENYPLTPAQKRLWVLSQLEGGSEAYNIPLSIQLKGDIKEGLFEETFKLLLEKYEILRTSFKTDVNTGEVRQFIVPTDKVDFSIDYKDFTKNSNTSSSVEEHISLASRKTFNLEAAPLFRVSLLKINAQEYILFLTMHHLISDGWTMQLLFSEFTQTYHDLIHNKKVNTNTLTIQYKDYSVWFSDQMSQPAYQKMEDYWLAQFKGEIPILSLPSSKQRPAIQTFNGTRISHTYSDDFYKKLAKFSEANNVTLFMTLMAGIKALLYNYSGQDDIILGTPIAGRNHPELENQIGLFLNTLAIRTQFDPKQPFSALLSKEKEVLLGAYENQIFPFMELVEKLSINRDRSRSALFDVFVILQNQNQVHVQDSYINDIGIETKVYEHKANTSQFDISFIFSEANQQLSLTLESNTDIYDSEFIQRIFIHLENILSDAIDYDTNVESLSYLSTEDEHRLVHQYNQTEQSYTKESTFLDIVATQVTTNPDAIAIQDAETSYTYKETWSRIEDISSHLVSTLGEIKEPIVVLLDRSSEMLLIILGILKSGKSYIPIDIGFPEDRINYIIEDSKAKYIITDVNLQLPLKGVNAKVLDKGEILKSEVVNVVTLPVSSEDTAYIIYTSGSTGKPKGVEIGHDSLHNFLLSMQKSPGISSSDRMYSVTTYSFDISILEFFVPLISGASVYISSRLELSDPLKLQESIEQYNPTIMQATPSFYQLLLDSGWLGNSALRVLCGGDALSEGLSTNLLGKVKELWNMYGPTETTIWSMLRKISEGDRSNNIGYPIDNTQIYLLDAQKELVPEGVVGQLYIGGSGLAKGYYQKESLTSERFISHRFSDTSKEETLYYTGDLGRRMLDGSIEFLGRDDYQVKLRGYRIELGEIEKVVLESSQEIKEAVVLAKESEGEKTLVAYYTSTKIVDKKALRDSLLKKLSGYMVPSYYKQLDSFPLTANGKIDRKSLPDITNEDTIKNEYKAPKNEIETKLVSIWENVLGFEKIGVIDNFFEIGGNSLNAIKIISKVQQEFNVQIDMVKLFQDPNIQGMSEEIENQNWQKEEVTEKTIVDSQTI
ncbi:Tyrocidine synthase 3 [Kordia antarctica]|uniref:Tyrocidine synthase 3 n=1 Tax=Kordia antarctica TaxID=1218801 RepID=A0A7L4ZFF1_9FLAO|nr:non-ribosomal peptide synthetase [Kordia antarctica]QHI35448.1 Tyrocidine synthase 3 [Kordia antarctica]